MPVKYNDIYFRLIASLCAAHLITVFGDRETLFQLFLDKFYYMALGSGFIIAFILVSVVNFVTRKLDIRYDWYELPVVRTGLQLLFGLMIPSVLAFILAAIYFKLNGINIFKTLYLRIDFPVIIGMIFIFNLYYLAYYLYLRMKFKEDLIRGGADNLNGDLTKDDHAKGKEVFIVNKGVKNIPLQIDTICYFYHDGNFNFLRTFDKEDFLISQALDEVQEQLPAKQFFRASRQMIVNFASCEHFEPLEYGKIELFVTPPAKDKVILSRKRANAFKKWIAR